MGSERHESLNKGSEEHVRERLDRQARKDRVCHVHCGKKFCHYVLKRSQRLLCGEVIGKGSQWLWVYRRVSQ